MTKYLDRPDGVSVMQLTRDASASGHPALDALEHGLRSLEPVAQIGSLEGDASTVFGVVEAVDMDESGNLYVLDSRFVEVRKFGPDGAHVETFGGAGRGPGEFVTPMSLHVDTARQQLYVGDGGRRLHVFDISGPSADFGRVLHLDGIARGVCSSDKELVIHAVPFSASHLFEIVDNGGSSTATFGAVYHSPVPQINFQFMLGRIACSSTHDLILYAPAGGIGELKAYRRDGSQRWIAVVEGFDPVVFIEEPDGYSVRGDDDGFNRVDSLLFLEPGLVILQVTDVHIAPGNPSWPEVRGVHTYILSVNDLEARYLGDDLPVLVAVSGNRFVGLEDRRFPQLTIYNARDPVRP